MSTKANFPYQEPHKDKALFSAQPASSSTSAASKTANSMDTAIFSIFSTIHHKSTTSTSNSLVAIGLTSTANSNKAQRQASAQSTSPRAKNSAAA